MFLLDTNVVSELHRSRADPNVMAWYGSTRSDGLFVSVVVIGELRQGIERLRRRDPAQAGALDTWLNGLKQTFSGRILKVTTAMPRDGAVLMLRTRCRRSMPSWRQRPWSTI